MWKATGRKPKALEQPERPTEFDYLWTAFKRMSHRRPVGEFGQLPISYAEFSAFSSFRSLPFREWEIAALERLDELYLTVK